MTSLDSSIDDRSMDDSSIDAGSIVPFTPAQVSFPEALASRAVDRRILAARTARVASGLALVSGAAYLVVSAVTGFHSLHAAHVIAGTWVVAGLAYPLVLAAARLFFHGNDPGRAGDRGMRASFSWPLAGLALMLPLSLHSLFYALTSTPREFDEWVQLSMGIVGHCHIALAAMAVRRVHRLAAGEKPLSASGIYGIVICVAMIPGAILILIPPILVALTGLPFLFLLAWPENAIAAERARLAEG